MIIVEGPDGSGKSTLVRRLAKDLQMPVAPRVVRADTTPMTDLAKWTEQNVSQGFQEVIFDRHRLISEPIYGPLLRKHQDTRFMDFAWLSDVLWRFYFSRPIIIYCVPDLRVIWNNVNRPETDNQAVADIRLMEAIYMGYISRATMDSTRGVGRLYNYRSTLYNDILTWVQYKLEEERDRARSEQNFTPLASPGAVS